MKDTVEVPVTWIKKLIELSGKANVAVYSNSLGIARADTTKLDVLKGYIESAEQFLPSVQDKENK